MSIYRRAPYFAVTEAGLLLANKVGAGESLVAPFLRTNNV